MRLASIRTNAGIPLVAAAVDGQYVDTGAAHMMEVIAHGDAALDGLTLLRTGATVDSPTVTAPLASPGKMLFCGTNYEDHLAELPDLPRPETPFFFAKLPNTIIGPNDDIVLPDEDLQTDYEAELAVVIGQHLRGASERQAREAIFGYTIVNDISARAVQFKDHQITLGKNLDTYCPMGPVIVTADEIPEPENLNIQLWVGDDLRQSSNTSKLIHSIPALISFLSYRMTLNPGDVIATGTPGGVGYARAVPTFLTTGDVVTVTVERVGTLSNRVIQRPPQVRA